MGIFNRQYAGKVTWEEIKPSGNSAPQYMRRAKIFGGWLVETENMTSSSGGLTFVPDANHEWELESK